MNSKRFFIKLIMFLVFPAVILFYFLIANYIIEIIIKQNLVTYKNELIMANEEKAQSSLKNTKLFFEQYYKKHSIEKRSKTTVEKHKLALFEYIKNISNEEDRYYIVSSTGKVLSYPLNNTIVSKNFFSLIHNIPKKYFSQKISSHYPIIIDHSFLDEDTNQKVALIYFEPFNWIIAKNFSKKDFSKELEHLELMLINKFNSTSYLLFLFILLSFLILFYFIVEVTNKSIFVPTEEKLNRLNLKLKNKLALLELKLYKDPLTNLSNLKRLKKDTKSNNCVLIMVDIDSFDNINKIYGYDIADSILVGYTNLLLSFSKKFNYKVYRVYSNTFVLMYNDNDLGYTHHYEKMLNLFDENYTTVKLTESNHKQEDIFNLDINVGMAFYEKNIVDKVTTALKKAKTLNKRFCIYSSILKDESSVKEFNDKKRLIYKAIHNNSIVPYFQPIVNDHGDIIKYESLMRLLDESNIISPVEFMDVAIKSKLYSKISIMMIEKALDIAISSNQSISVNLSTSDMRNSEFSAMLDSKLKDIHFAKLVTFEILEDKNIDDIEMVEKFLRRYRTLGVKIAIDDFGTGYSNFANIVNLKPDYIKIDGSLIRDINNNKENFELVKSIFTFANNLNINVIAEFIHSEDVLSSCKKIGINIFQGYYFYEPQKKFL